MTLCALSLLLWTSTGRAAQVVGGVVRSREYKIRRAPVFEEEFTGDVSYRSAASLLRSDWALYKHDTHDWRAKGSVDIRHKLTSGDILDARGSEALYNDKTRAGALLARQSVEFSRTPPSGEPDYGRAKLAQWNDDHVILTEQVQVWGPRVKLWAQRADYDRRRSQLELTGGRPVVQKMEGRWTGAVKADKISAWDKTKRLEADGNASGWIQLKAKSLKDTAKEPKP